MKNKKIVITISMLMLSISSFAANVGQNDAVQSTCPDVANIKLGSDGYYRNANYPGWIGWGQTGVVQSFLGAVVSIAPWQKATTIQSCNYSIEDSKTPLYMSYIAKPMPVIESYNKAAFIDQGNYMLSCTSDINTCWFSWPNN